MNRIFGKVFKDDVGNEFGVIRKTTLPFPEDISEYEVIAEDECGNYFLNISDCIIFWDHETNTKVELSKTLHEFISKCTQPSEIELDPSDIISVWVDPDFAKEFGISPNPNKKINKDT
jgi:hypothetical protein